MNGFLEFIVLFVLFPFFVGLATSLIVGLLSTNKRRP